MSQASSQWDPRWREVHPNARQQTHEYAGHERPGDVRSVHSAASHDHRLAQAKAELDAKSSGVHADVNRSPYGAPAASSALQWQEAKTGHLHASPNVTSHPSKEPHRIPIPPEHNMVNSRQPGSPPSMPLWRLNGQRDDAAMMERPHYEHAGHAAPASKMSLPPIASFREGGWRQDSPATTTSHPNSAQAVVSPTCWCSRMAPMLHTAAKLLRSLDSSMRLCSSRELNKFNPSYDSPVDTLQWMIDTLSLADSEAMGNKVTLVPATKRGSDSNDTSVKRLRTDNLPSGDHHSPTPSTTTAPDATLSAQRYKQSPLSPVTLPSLDLAQPRPQSTSNSHRLLPSPSSLINPAPILQSLAYGPSVSPHDKSYADAASSPAVHQVSTSAAASQHIADLQHQITLKTLALQSLQKEHTNLLQKWHRERVKTHAIEKKCQVADQEINELTARNEELGEQLKNLELQLTRHESRREEDATATAREKEQWGRMLEMSGRLHLKVSEERQRLQQENEALEKRVLWYEQENQARFDRSLHSGSLSNVGSNDGRSTHGELPPFGSPSDERFDSSTKTANVANPLQSQVDALRSALKDAQQQNSDIEAATQALITQRASLKKVLDEALNSNSKQAIEIENINMSIVEPQLMTDAVNTPSLQSAVRATEGQPAARSTKGKDKRPVTDLRRQRSTDILLNPQSTDAASAKRLGIEVMPTTSSPEEIVKALGPAPMMASSSEGDQNYDNTSFGRAQTQPSARMTDETLHYNFMSSKPSSAPHAITPSAHLAVTQG